MTDNDNTIDSAAECDPTARGTELVYTTVENSRLLTLPATEIKYYLPDARDNWNADSDEVILLLQFFDNCLASGDARSLELARRAFNNLNEKDDEALLETLGFVLVRWLPDDELLAYLNTEKPEYLDAAKRIAANFMAHIRPDGLTDCDFCQPDTEERIDNIAGAIAACGLMELEKATGDEAYRNAALRLVDGLLEHCCDWTDQRLGVLTHCTASYHDDGAGRHTNIVYGDYFLMEALAKLNGTDLMPWL